MKCPICDGDGLVLDHSDAHHAESNDPDCGKYGCPVQRECTTCEGQGEIIEPGEPRE